MKKISQFLLVFLFSCSAAMAQAVDMADTMRSNGKIYVVVGVLLIIFIGLITYLIMIDRKLTKIERRIGSK